MKIYKTFEVDIPYKEATVADRLSFLLTANGMTQAEAARRSNYTQASIGHWLNGTRKLNIDALVIFAKMFNVSTDWILGLEDRDL